jgi:hypothetical protein
VRRGEYRDPAIVLERRQEASCAGCTHLERDLTPGFRKFTCSKGIQKASQDVLEMPKCRKFTEGRSAVGVKEKIVGAVQSSNLRWDAEYERAIDRLTALGMSDPLGSALLRAKYCNDHEAGKRALFLLTDKAANRLGVMKTYAKKLAVAALKEFMLDTCEKCRGTGSVMEGGHAVQCSKCGGTGAKQYTDTERALAASMPVESWAKGHDRKFEEVLICMNGAAAAVIGRVRDLLKVVDDWPNSISKNV